LRRFGVPLAPVLIAVILGPLAETSLRRALAISEGDVGALFSSGLTLSCTPCCCSAWSGR
jgi:putative tricarboxylic transport membrane protein